MRCTFILIILFCNFYSLAQTKKTELEKVYKKARIAILRKNLKSIESTFSSFSINEAKEFMKQNGEQYPTDFFKGVIRLPSLKHLIFYKISTNQFNAILIYWLRVGKTRRIKGVFAFSFIKEGKVWKIISPIKAGTEFDPLENDLELKN